MKIIYCTSKWEKAIDIEKRSAKDVFSKTPIEDQWNIDSDCKRALDGYINGYYLVDEFRKYDKIQLLFCLKRTYHWYFDSMNLIFKDYEKSFGYLYLYYKSIFAVYDEFKINPSTSENFVHEIEKGVDIEAYISAAIAVNEWEESLRYAYRLPYLEAMIKEEYEKAREELIKIPEPTKMDYLYEVYYYNVKYTKNIMLAIIEKDEKKFNEELMKRIKLYRKNSVNYAILFDVISVAMIKLAKRRGISYTFSVAEIPEFFLDMERRVDKEKYKLIEIPEREE